MRNAGQEVNTRINSTRTSAGKTFSTPVNARWTWLLNNKRADRGSPPAEGLLSGRGALPDSARRFWFGVGAPRIGTGSCLNNAQSSCQQNTEKTEISEILPQRLCPPSSNLSVHRLVPGHPAGPAACGPKTNTCLTLCRPGAGDVTFCRGPPRCTQLIRVVVHRRHCRHCEEIAASPQNDGLPRNDALCQSLTNTLIPEMGHG